MKTLILFFSILTGSISLAATPDYDSAAKSFQKTLSDLVKAKTVSPPGNEDRAVKIIAARLKKEGIAFQTMDFAPHRSNLVARLKGSGEKKALLLLAHIDVVGVDRQTWTYPPHELTEKDGFLYGRGVQDDLGMGVANLEVFIALKKLKVPLKRDIILAFTGDEESGGLGIRVLLEKHPEWISDAELGLNEGGSPISNEQGQIQYINMASAEKTYQDFQLNVKGASGHSSLPQGDNSITVLAQALERFSQYKPEMRLLPVTRDYFKKRAAVESPEVSKAMLEIANAKGKLPQKALDVVSKIPTLNAQLITTCIPTMISGGSRVNALPPEATANINCRILPDESIDQVKKRITDIIKDVRVEITTEGDFSVGGASPIDGIIPTAVEKIAGEFWPKAPVIASMLTGATDSRFIRNKTHIYGLSPLYRLEKDLRAHGVDERMPVSSIKPGLEFLYRLVLEVAQ